ncbi:MAG: DUF2845 domain-containing protein [Gammaproteobacteria bacterium]
MDTGDSAASVRQRCGKPDFIYPDASASRRNRSGSREERWYYNSGPSQLLRVLLFQKGVLKEIDTLGYGFNPALHRCTPQDIRFGMSAYELANRCGKPKRRRSAHASAGTRTAVWTYDFGSQYLLQNVTISGGQVQSVETTSHHARRSQPRR